MNVDSCLLDKTDYEEIYLVNHDKKLFLIESIHPDMFTPSREYHRIDDKLVCFDPCSYDDYLKCRSHGYKFLND